jgi:putative NADH-flavin reductase
MKTLAIFGATGRTGIHLVRQAVVADYAVKALCRKSAAFPVPEEAICVREGDILNYDDVKNTVQGTLAVISAIGTRPKHNDIFCARATENIVAAMKEIGIRRIICISGAMIGNTPVNRSKFMQLLMNRYNKKHPAIAEDRNLQEEIIMKSGLDWTIVKPPRLSKGKAKGKYMAGEDVKATAFSSITRGELAGFIVSQLSSVVFVDKLPVIRN